MKVKNIPTFATEQEEAKWWDEHRDETAEWMVDAIESSEVSKLSDVLDRAHQGAVSIPVDPEDVSRAHAQAARKGLHYQTYLKMLLHDALEREERAS